MRFMSVAECVAQAETGCVPLWYAASEEYGDTSRLLAALAHAVPLPSRWDESVSRGRGGVPPLRPRGPLTGSSEPDGSQRKGTP